MGFASRILITTEKNYSQLDKEVLGIVFGVKKFHRYLFGRRFEIKTDHKPLTHIFKESKAMSTMASGRIQRWALTLGAYDYTIQHRDGKHHANADALSRLPLPDTHQETPRPAEVVHLMEHLQSRQPRSRLGPPEAPFSPRSAGWYRRVATEGARRRPGGFALPP